MPEKAFYVVVGMGMYNAITDVPGIKVGHYTDREAATGCTVILCEQGATAGVDIRGSASGTREIDSLSLTHLVQEIHAVLLSGGSAFGLDAAGGVMRYLEERGYGLDMRLVRVPIVPTAILYDLSLGNAKVRPGVEQGYQSCLAATSGEVAEGTVGAGTGTTVGKARGINNATKSGIGTASQRIGDDLIVGAIVAVNAVGEVIDPETGEIIAGVRNRNGGGFIKTTEVWKNRTGFSPPVGTNTTIGVVATNACLDKVQATKVAQMAHDGLARTIRPAHTMLDGDTIFALSLNKGGDRQENITMIGAVAAEVMVIAVVRAVRMAETLLGIPAAGDV